ncbi:aminoglycoside 6-adenylyltransferase [Salipaludibacillus neizhouensis]|uniref:Aminoglycoside 6-adenylyltransferase n=1 Tax=Salipaludibacillus neizhouensis TaxID=885475 RepID=A0A3A9KIB3_9BACI|nr:aminoglycoside 6-adenylyltransferase [Salipaludibacillus neizhouensis]RKL64696.1 aminoglycoside 6-adenylyltransferase [Salipaludibacillus neizhouensis]
MRKQEKMFDQLLEWGKRNEEIRTIILTSSRANPYAFKDVFTDYDIELFVNDLLPFLNSDKWMEHFGEVVTFDPLKPLEKDGWITRLVLYADGTKIDFQISINESVRKLTNKSHIPLEYDNGYMVLLDKDNITEDIKPPSYSAFVTKKPTEDEYRAVINEFWWDTTYVAKSLWRDELYFAKYMLDNIIRFNYLQKVIEWYIGVQNDWKVNPNKCGRWFKRYLNKETWEELETTFVGADIEENWNALFRTANLFNRLCREIGEELGYEYPVEVENKIRSYLLKAKNLDNNATTFQ